MSIPVLKLVAKAETDLVLVRYRTKQIADLAGMSEIEKTRLVIAVSEILRNAIMFANEARVEFNVKDINSAQFLEVVVFDNGKGFTTNGGPPHEKKGGLWASQNLVDDFQIQTGDNGTIVKMCKATGKSLGRITVQNIEEWIHTLKKNSPFSVVEDLEQQNKQLLDTLTELEKIKSKLEERTDELHQANKYKGEFLANMSHEIRTPMNAIIGLSNILDRTELTDDQRKFLRLIKNSGGSLLDLINDILDFSKIEAGKLVIETAKFNLFDVIETCIEILSTSAHSKAISVFAWIDPEIPGQVLGDSVRLRQVLTNLLSNAIKFTERGEVVARARVLLREGNEVRIRFEVTDSGIGLSLEKQQKLFKPFVQADGSTTRKYGGTGLGLSICKQLVDLMGGTIGVDSVEGVGSTFWFELPYEVAEESSNKDRKKPQFKRALIVDDHISMREMASYLLKTWSIENQAVASAREALNLVEHTDFDLFILDYVMPEMNGLELVSELRKIEKLRNARILLFTALQDEEGLGVRAISSGCNAFLTKPLRQSQFYDCLLALSETGTFTQLSSKATAGADTATASKVVSAVSSAGIEQAIGEIEQQTCVLLVEDNPTNQIVASIELRNIGLEVIIANNGAEAVELSSAQDFAAIFMDCQMPVLNGYEATRRIRKRELKTGKRVPIVAMTANAMEGDREQCISAGMDDYLTKPFQTEDLIAVADKWILRTTPVGALSIADYSEKEEEVDSVSEIDYEKFRAKFNETQAKQLLTVFLSDTANKLVELESLIKESNLTDIAKLAHNVKGAASMIFADALANAASELEATAKAQSVENLPELNRRLNQRFERLRDTAKQMSLN